MTRPFARTAGLSVGLLALAACGSGQMPQNYAYRAAADSTTTNGPGLEIRNMHVEHPEEVGGYKQGSDAPVVLTAISSLEQGDVLVSASTPAAAYVELVTADGTFQLPPGGASDPADGLLLTGLTGTLQSGSYALVTLVFASGATVDVNTPVSSNPEEAQKNPDFTVPETDSEGEPLTEGGPPPDNAA